MRELAINTSGEKILQTDGKSAQRPKSGSVPDAFQDAQRGKDDWSGEQARERSEREVRVSGNQVVSVRSIRLCESL